MNDFEIIEQQVTRVNEDIKTFKAGLAGALNTKGVPTSAKDSTVQIIANIGKIEGGGSGGELVSGTKIPSDMLLPPRPNRTITNEGNTYKTYGSVWVEELNGFIIAGENYGDNISVVKLDGTIERHNYPGLKMFFYDKIDKCTIIVQEVDSVNYIKKINSSFSEEWSISYSNYGGKNPFEIKRFNNNYYIFTGKDSDFNNCYMIKTSLQGEILKTINVKEGSNNSNSVITKGFYIDEQYIVIRTSDNIFILNSDTLEILKIHAVEQTYEHFEIFKYKNYYLVERGYGMDIINSDNINEITINQLIDIYYPTFMYQLEEGKFIIVCNNVIRIITLDFENGFNLTYEDKLPLGISKLTIMKDGNYLCEYEDFKMAKLHQDFTEEWKVDTYGTQNWVDNNQLITFQKEFVHEQGDYIYYVRKGAVLELDFVPSFIVK